MLTQETLKLLLHYCPETGVFTNIKAPRRGISSGSIAGTLTNRGYMQIKVNQKRYQAHRLAWLYVHGTFPPDELDHINRVKSDNRIENLRLATQAENMQNITIPRHNTSGHMGVAWHKQTQKWRAYISVNKKQRSLGLFSDLSEAISARNAAKPKYHLFNHPGAA